MSLHRIGRTRGLELRTVFKTMWNMPAVLSRLGNDDTPGGGETLAKGSLGEMIRAADEHQPDHSLIIQCAGRDRPITWAEIEGLRRSSGLLTDA